MKAKFLSLHLPVALAAMLAAPMVFGATLTAITPSVDHSKKATCGIKWTINKNQSIQYFEVYRGTSDDFDEADLIAEVDNTTTRLTDWGADQYQTYYYWVIPYDYNDESNVLSLDLTRYACENHRYWGSSDVYLTASVKTLAIGNTLPLYFKVNMGTSGDPMYDHVKPDRVVFTRMTDLKGNTVNDIAEVYGNRGTSYSTDDTYLKANGAFGYLVPRKPGVLYMRAYYKSATTVSPLRIEIKEPTFNLYAPEGEIDIVDNMYRDLYLKCNGKFVCPEVESNVSGEDYISVLINGVLDIASSDDNGVSDGLYENSFGFLEMVYSDEWCSYDITYNDILVKEYLICPVWDTSRTLSIFLVDTNGRTPSQLSPSTTYLFGINYGSKTIPRQISKYGYNWTTYGWYDWGFVDSNCYGMTELGSYNISTYGEIGYFVTGSGAQWMQLSLYLFDRHITNTYYIKNN